MRNALPGYQHGNKFNTQVDWAGYSARFAARYANANTPAGTPTAQPALNQLGQPVRSGLPAYLFEPVLAERNDRSVQEHPCQSGGPCKCGGTCGGGGGAAARPIPQPSPAFARATIADAPAVARRAAGFGPSQPYLPPDLARQFGPHPSPVPGASPDANWCKICVEVHGCKPESPCRAAKCCCKACDEAIAANKAAALAGEPMSQLELTCPQPHCQQACCPKSGACNDCAAELASSGTCPPKCMMKGCCFPPPTCGQMFGGQCTLKAHQAGCCTMEFCQWCAAVWEQVSWPADKGPKPAQNPLCKWLEQTLGPMGKLNSAGQPTYCGCEPKVCPTLSWGVKQWGGDNCAGGPFDCDKGWIKHPQAAPWALGECRPCCRPSDGVVAPFPCGHRCPCPPGKKCLNQSQPTNMAPPSKGETVSLCLADSDLSVGPNGCPQNYWFWDGKPCFCGANAQMGPFVAAGNHKLCNPCGKPDSFGNSAIPQKDGTCAKIDCANRVGHPIELATAHPGWVKSFLTVAGAALSPPNYCPKNGTAASVQNYCFLESGVVVKIGEGNMQFKEQCAPAGGNLIPLAAGKK